MCRKKFQYHPNQKKSLLDALQDPTHLLLKKEVWQTKIFGKVHTIARRQLTQLIPPLDKKGTILDRASQSPFSSCNVRTL